MKTDGVFSFDPAVAPPALIAVLEALFFPSAASALQFEIVNESGREAKDVYVTVTGESGRYNVPSIANDVPEKLSEITNQTFTVEELISGRVYISYGAPVEEGVSFESPTRFDWAELTVTPAAEDVANLTAVDQFAIGMRLDTYGPVGKHLETVGDANSDTIFNALQQIPGGPQATIRNGSEMVRVLSPLHSGAYPQLGDCVRSMAGKTISLHTAFFGSPFTTTEYTGTFAADGSIALRGTTNPISATPPTIELSGSELIEDIYTGANTPNDIEGAIRRDLLSGFSAGFWDGRYSNDSLSFRSNPETALDGAQFCPKGFDQPSFSDARASLSSFPTCEQYAAVINQYSDVYGNPYSDASKKVAVALDQPVDGGEVEKLRLTILPDSGSEMPAVGGNAECGAGSPVPPAATTATATTATKSISRSPAGATVGLHLRKLAKVHGGKVLIGTISCKSVCGKVTVVARKGKTIVARGTTKLRKAKGPLTLKLTRPGRKLLAAHRRVRVVVTVSAAGAKATGHGSLTFSAAPARHRRSK